MGQDLILASQSPYRRELLSRLGVPFKTATPLLDERPFKEKTRLSQLAKTLAWKKAQSVLPLFPQALIIASDQTVSLGQTLFSKPKSPSRAQEQLHELQGKTHQLTTAVCLLGQDEQIEFQQTAYLTMRPLGSQEIQRYIKRDQPLDCAGSYKIERGGITLFEKIEVEDFTTIIGLPLIELTSSLRQLGHLL